MRSRARVRALAFEREWEKKASRDATSARVASRRLDRSARTARPSKVTNRVHEQRSTPKQQTSRRTVVARNTHIELTGGDPRAREVVGNAVDRRLFHGAS